MRRGIFRRQSVEAWVESGFDRGSNGGGVVIWHGTLIRQLSPEQIEELLIATGSDSDPDVVLAKVKWLIKSTTPNVFAYVVDLLKGKLETARSDRDRFAATIQELRHNNDVMLAAKKRIEQERDEAKPQIAGLRDAFRFAEQSVRDCVAKGYRATSIRSADGETIERGDNAFLGSDPERRLILIDCAEAICAENLRVVGLPDGVPVFAKRDSARAWKRSQRNHLSPPESGAAPMPAMPTASPGVGDGAAQGCGEADLLSFIGVGAAIEAADGTHP